MRQQSLPGRSIERLDLLAGDTNLASQCSGRRRSSDAATTAAGPSNLTSRELPSTRRKTG
jgi:hypothetical protein